MKRILFAAAALMALVGCQKDEVTTPSGTMPKVITASFEQAGGSRVAVDNYGQLTWTAGDSFYIIDKNDNSKTDLYEIKSEGIGQATASFELSGGSEVNEVAYAVYPEPAYQSFADGTLTMWVSGEMSKLPMLAKTSSATNISFKHLCAALRINFSEIPDGYLYAIIEAASPIKGRFEANLSDAEPVLVAVDGFADKQALYPLTNSVVDMPLPVGTYESLTVKIAKDPLGAEALTLKSWSNLEVKRAKLYTTSASGQVADLSELPATTPAEQKVVADKLVEALSNPEVGVVKLPAAVSVPITEKLSFGAPVSRAAAIAARNITIDGNGSTLVWKGASGGRVIDVTNEANGMNLTLKNLTIENKTSYTERGVNYNTTGKLTLEKVTIKSADNCKITYAINLPGSSDNATVEITNSDICGNIALNLWGENTKVTITNSEIKSVDNSAAEGYAAIVLNDDGTTAATGSKITVTGGKIIAKDENGVASTAVQNECIAAEVTISDETEVVGEKLNAVAVILYANTDNYYSIFTLQEAIDKAAETAGCTLKLIRDITLTEAVTIPASANFTLDLNGLKISQTKEQTAGYSMITNDGKLTIVDSSESKSGLITYTDSGNGGEYVSNTITNRGTLTVKGGTIENASSEATADVGFCYAIDTSIWGSASETVVNIEGGKIISVYSPLRVRADSTTEKVEANISGGKLYGRVELQMSSSTAGVIGILNITDGEFNLNGITEQVVQVFGAGTQTDACGIVAKISGGKFNGPVRVYDGAYVPIGQNFNRKFISGGSFKADPSEYVAEGLRAKEINGVWQIVNAYELQDEADLFWLANEVNVKGNTFAGKTFTLMNNITLTKTWTPIGDGTEKNLRAAFDGNYKTISKMKIEGTEYVGFFGSKVAGDVTNLYIDQATISGTHYAGGIVGWMHNVAEVGHNAVLNVKGCKVTNSNITLDTDATPDNGDKAGGIVGFVYLGTIDGCSVANTNIKAYRDCGGIVGIASTYLNGSTNYYPNVSNNTVGANVKLTVDNDQNYKNYTVQGDYDFDHIIGEAGQNTVAEGNSGTVTIEWGTIPAK